MSTRLICLGLLVAFGAIPAFLGPETAFARENYECSGSQGACTWTVSHFDDGENPEHFYDLDCPGASGVHIPIDNATACDLCCPLA